MCEGDAQSQLSSEIPTFLTLLTYIPQFSLMLTLEEFRPGIPDSEYIIVQHIVFPTSLQTIRVSLSKVRLQNQLISCLQLQMLNTICLY